MGFAELILIPRGSRAVECKQMPPLHLVPVRTSPVTPSTDISASSDRFPGVFVHPAAMAPAHSKRIADFFGSEPRGHAESARFRESWKHPRKHRNFGLASGKCGVWQRQSSNASFHESLRGVARARAMRIGRQMDCVRRVVGEPKRRRTSKLFRNSSCGPASISVSLRRFIQLELRATTASETTWCKQV
jgi:hypothetical protein